jgi:type VI secretion system protein ImpG
MNFEQIYSEELALLDKLGNEFAQNYPAIAGYLSSHSTDPDVLRLLQGFSFLTAMVRQKLEDDLPEMVNSISDLVGPNLIRAFPAITVLNLTIEGKNNQGFLVPQGTTFASQPVDDINCQFSTSWDAIVQPIQLQQVNLDSAENGSKLTLTFECIGIPASQWTGENISLYLSGSYQEASMLLMALRYQLDSAVVYEDGEEEFATPIQINFPGLDIDLPLLKHHQDITHHLRWIREFMFFPERALFLELKNLDQRKKGSTKKIFKVVFNLKESIKNLPKINNNQFRCNVVPAANVFETFVDPIEITHLQEHYPLRPMGYRAHEAQILDVISVTGRVQGSSIERQYLSSRETDAYQQKFVYQLLEVEAFQKGSSSHRLRIYLTDDIDLTKREILSVKVLCTNANLPSRIRVNDISLRTENSPEKIRVTNLIRPVGSARASFGEDALWKIIAQARMSIHSLEEKSRLKEYLSNYLSISGDEPVRIDSARRRIEGINDISVEECYEMSMGNVLRGKKIIVSLKGDFYSGIGDIFIFGEILANFFVSLVDLNSFVSVVVKDEVSGRYFEWPKLITVNHRL